MKRALDEIELEEIESFYMEQRTLIIRTQTEDNTYQYQSELELLRKIGYFFHRYEVEYNRREETAKNNKVILTPKQQECIRRIHKKRNFTILMGVLYPFLVLMFPLISDFLLKGLVLVDIVLVASGYKDSLEIRRETSNQATKKVKREKQIDKGFHSLKEASQSYLNRITKNGTTIGSEEKHYIEQIEKGYQKRIGALKQQ